MGSLKWKLTLNSRSPSPSWMSCEKSFNYSWFCLRSKPHSSWDKLFLYVFLSLSLQRSCGHGAIQIIRDTFFALFWKMWSKTNLILCFLRLLGLGLRYELERKCLLKPNQCFKKVKIFTWHFVKHSLPLEPECHILIEWPLTNLKSRVKYSRRNGFFYIFDLIKTF